MLKGLFGAPKPRDPQAAERIKAWVREIVCDDIAQRETIAVTVSEIICTDPGCPGTETVILIMRPLLPTVAAKVAKPMDEVGESDAKGAAVIAVR
jgi:hypothetical protein